MNKKIIAVIALVLVLTIGLVACNGKTYKSSGVADGNKYASSPVENNGSFVVKQGGYVYFVNAYVGADAENKFGKQEKSCLYRAELDENGNIIEGSRVALVNKNIYSTSTKSGIYVRGNWIYFASPNTDKTKSGEVNTKYLDFFRVSLDGKKTELLYTIANRSADFFVTDNSLLVLDGGALKKIDLNKKSLGKINNKKNYVEVRSNVSSLQPIVANGAFSGMALMVSNAADSDSWKKFNTLSVIYADGTIKDVITDNSFGGDADSYLYNATVSVKDYVVKGDKITVYYTKTDKDSKVQLCAYTFGTDFSFDSKNEVLLMKDASSSNVAAVKGIDEKSAFVTVSSAPYLKKVKYVEQDKNPLEQDKNPQNVPASATNPESQLQRQITIRDVRDGYVFYTDASSAKALFRYKYDTEDLRYEECVAEFNLSSSWFAPVILGDYMYFLDGTKEYTYRVKLQTGDIVKPETKNMVVGKMTADDYKAVFESENE